MSTPNTSLVKWVLEKDLFASYAKVAEYQERDNIAAPVIPLADITELVEGLRDATAACTTADNAYSKGYTDGRNDVLTVLFAQLEAHRKEGENDEG